MKSTEEVLQHLDGYLNAIVQMPSGYGPSAMGIETLIGFIEDLRQFILSDEQSPSNPFYQFLDSKGIGTTGIAMHMGSAEGRFLSDEELHIMQSVGQLLKEYLIQQGRYDGG